MKGAGYLPGMQVTEIWRYPVKSMGGERLTSAMVGSLGVEGDRGWGVFDVETGNVLTARRSPDLLMMSARVVDGDAIVTLPDGTDIESSKADTPLSIVLDRPVELRSAGDEGGTYENPMDVENDADWVSWTGPAGAWHDSGRSRVSLVSTASLGDWDIRRFRTNIVLDGSGEDDFVGDAVAIGDDLVLDVTKRIDRCVMITRPQPGLDRDIELLKQINRERESCLSIGALIATPGTIEIGSQITVR